MSQVVEVEDLEDLQDKVEPPSPPYSPLQPHRLAGEDECQRTHVARPGPCQLRHEHRQPHALSG